MGKSVVVVGCESKYIDALASVVATKNGMMFSSTRDLIVYTMQGMIGDVSFVDNDYINEKVSEALQEVCDYENCIITVDASTIQSDKNFTKKLKNLPIIYVVKKIESSELDIIYEERHKILKNFAHYVVEEADFDTQQTKLYEVIESIKNEK